MYGIKRKRTEGNKIIDDGKEKAREILTKYRPALDVISKKLFEVETLEREQYEVLLKAEGVPINDVYRDARIAEEKMGDPTKVLEGKLAETTV